MGVFARGGRNHYKGQGLSRSYRSKWYILMETRAYLGLMQRQRSLREDAITLFVTRPLASGRIGDMTTMLVCGVALRVPLLTIKVGAVVAARTTSV